MTAVTGRHQARLHEITRPIRMSTVRRLRAQSRHRRCRQMHLHRIDVYAFVLAALGLLLVALLNVVARGGLS